MYPRLKTQRTSLADHESGHTLREAEWLAHDHATWGRSRRCKGANQDHMGPRHTAHFHTATICVASHMEWRITVVSDNQRKKFVYFTATLLREGNLQNLPLILMFFSKILQFKETWKFSKLYSRCTGTPFWLFHGEGFRKTEHSKSTRESSLQLQSPK